MNTHKLEIHGYQVEIRTRETAWKTWTAEAHVTINAHHGVVISQMAGTEDDLTKQYTTEEEGIAVVQHLATMRIEASLRKTG